MQMKSKEAINEKSWEFTGKRVGAKEWFYFRTIVIAQIKNKKK
jgi:hypothetical protein